VFSAGCFIPKAKALTTLLAIAVTFFLALLYLQVISFSLSNSSWVKLGFAQSQQLQYATRIFRKGTCVSAMWLKPILALEIYFFVKVVFGYFRFPLPIKLLHSSSTPLLTVFCKGGLSMVSLKVTLGNLWFSTIITFSPLAKKTSVVY
jgi:hypothetical protein